MIRYYDDIILGLRTTEVVCDDCGAVAARTRSDRRFSDGSGWSRAYLVAMARMDGFREVILGRLLLVLCPACATPATEERDG